MGCMAIVWMLEFKFIITTLHRRRIGKLANEFTICFIISMHFMLYSNVRKPCHVAVGGLYIMRVSYGFHLFLSLILDLILDLLLFVYLERNEVLETDYVLC